MKYLIVGLGNKWAEYAETRHNIGVKIVDELANAAGVSFQNETLAHIARIKYKGKQLILVKPTTYMNLSGKAIKHWMSAERISPKNLLIITDDISIDLGKLRIRGKGSPGGHNGLKDIEAQLGTDSYDRIRFGAGNDYPKGRQVEFVLGQWDESESIELALQKDRTCLAIEAWIIKGLNGVMNEFSG